MTETGGQAATLLARMCSSGINEDRARGWIEQGAVRVAGDTVSDVDAVVPWPAAWTLSPA